jgi:hypothetical protein
MKKMILIPFLFPVLAWAGPSPTPLPAPTGDVADMLLQMMPDVIAMGKTLPGVLGAIFVALVAVAAGILLIARYYNSKGARETAAYEADQQARKIQTDNLARMQRDAVQAMVENLEESYRQDYEYLTQKIQAKDYAACYLKFSPMFREKIAAFLYDEALPAAQRAGQIILIVKPQDLSNPTP